MSTEQSDLPGYEEIIASLAAKLEGLSTVHSGLGEAAESLVLAHQEMDQTKQRIESLATSAQSMVEEVQRLQPAELAATLDARLVSLSRESSESLGAMSQRLLTVASEIAVTRNRADEGFATLEELVTTRHHAISQAVANIHRQQGELDRQQTELAQQIALLTAAVTGVRNVVDSTSATSMTTKQIVQNMGPSFERSLRSTRNDIFVALILIVVAIAVAWVILSGYITNF